MDPNWNQIALDTLALIVAFVVGCAGVSAVVAVVIRTFRL